MGSTDFYENDQITVERIEMIKKGIMEDSDNGPYNIYAARDDGTWMQMCFRWDMVLIDIICEPDHRYTYYNKKYEGQTDLELMEFDQDDVPRAVVCDDMLLAADIFEEWALHGKLYPTTWVDMAASPNIFDAYYGEKKSEDYYRLYLTGFGANKAKTIVFVKKYFRDSDFDQARKRTEKFPLLLCVAFESEVLPLEEQLQKIGADYKKEKISDDIYMKLYYANPQETLWHKLEAYLRL